MNRLLTILLPFIFCAGTSVHSSAAQLATPPLTVRGDLLSTKEDTCVVRDISGVLRHIRADKDTRKERLMLRGERIEIQVSFEGRSLAIKPA
ncbi:MAG: hypothetical protein ACM34B_06260 [Nitrospira sp.]